MPTAIANKQRVKEHYNLLSTWYRDLWGIHIHHGYWQNGSETKEKAQEQLIDYLATSAGLKEGQRVLDVGCGIGGSSVYLAKKFNAKVKGITISPVQVRMATDYAKLQNADAEFLLMDADNLAFDSKFDVVWSIEAISHFDQRENFFASVANLLPKGGRLVLMDWFKTPTLTQEQEQDYLEPIKFGMLVPNINTIESYTSVIEKCGLKVINSEDISSHVSKTWDITFEAIQKPSLWRLALRGGSDFVAFLKAFRVMKKGYKSKTLIYGMIVAEKI